MKEMLSIRGIVDIQLFSQNGSLIRQETVNNLVTSAGKNFVVRKINNESGNVGSIVIGTSTTPPTLTDTLGQVQASALAEVNVTFTVIEDNTIIFTTAFEENIGTGTINEVSLLSDESPKKVLCRTVVTTPFAKAATDYLVVSWKLQIG
jgi:hypothetical protein